MADAHLTFLKPDVNRRTEQQTDWKPAERGDGLFRLDQVNTLRGAGAEITFHDHSAVQLDENALIVIYGDGATAKENEKTGEVEVVQGDAAISLSSLRGEKPMRVQTPGARVVMRSPKNRAATDNSQTGRVVVDKAQMSRISMFNGEAFVSAYGQDVTVKSGYGTRIEKGKPPEAPTKLPDATHWTDAIPTARIFFGESALLHLAFAPVERAVHYRVQFSRDAAFNDHVIDRVIDAPTTAFDATLPAGAYFARVWATDDKGLDGAPTPERKLVLATAQSKDAACDEQGVVRGVDAMTLVLSGPSDLPLSIDGAAAAPLGDHRSIRFDQHGRHSLGIAGSAPLEIELSATPLAAPPAPEHKIPAVSQTRGPLGSANDIAGGTPLPTAFVESGLLLQARLQPEPAKPSSRERTLLGALDLEASNGWIALDVSVTSQSNPLSTGHAFTYPTVGLRARLLGDDDHLSLSLGGDVSTSGGSTDGLELTRGRAWLAGGWRAGRFTLSTTQAISNGSYGTGVGYEASLVGAATLCPGLLAHAEFDVQAAGLCPGGNCAAVAGSLGLRTRWQFLELGAAMRTGLNPIGRTFWGSPGALITLGLRLGGRDN